MTVLLIPGCYALPDPSFSGVVVLENYVHCEYSVAPIYCFDQIALSQISIYFRVVLR